MTAATQLPALPVLKPEERDMITDVVFIENPNFGDATELAEARCYIGDNTPRWLADPKNIRSNAAIEQLTWLADFYIELTKRHRCPEGPEAFDAMRKRDLCFRFSHSGSTFRGSRTKTFDGRVRLTMRRIPEVTPILDCDRSKSDLVMPAYVPDLLLAKPFRRSGGMLLVCAPVGQGKSTTIAATIAARLRLFGGQTITIEDPCELYLHGFHGFGDCVQTEVVSDEEGALAEAIRASLRGFAVFPGGGASLFISEIRNGADAAEACRAAQAGYFVVATLHCQSPINAVFRLQSLTADVVGEKAARDMVAASLRMVMYQTLSLIPKPGLGWKRGSLAADILFNPSPDSTVANIIRDPAQSLSALAEPLQKQRALLSDAARERQSFAQVYGDLGGNSNDL
jgi:Tfp pilus assembly pilus retraction ATPase PilT